MTQILPKRKKTIHDIYKEPLKKTKKTYLSKLKQPHISKFCKSTCCFK